MPFTVCSNVDWHELHILPHGECQATVTNSSQCHIWRTAYVLNLPHPPRQGQLVWWWWWRFIMEFTFWKDQDPGWGSWGHLSPARTHSIHIITKQTRRTVYALVKNRSKKGGKEEGWKNGVGKKGYTSGLISYNNKLQFSFVWEAGTLQIA